MSKMLLCLLVSQNIVVSETGYRDRECVWKCQKNEKEVELIDPQYQCPKELYIDNPYLKGIKK